MRTIRCVLLALTLATRTVHADPPAPDEALAREADDAAASGQRARAAELRTEWLARLGDTSTPLALATLRALADDYERLHELPRALRLHLKYARHETAAAPAAEALSRALVLASALGDTAQTREALDRLTDLARDTPALRETAAEQVLAFAETLGPQALDNITGTARPPSDARAVLTLLDRHSALFGPAARLDLRLRASVLRGRALRALGDAAGAWQAFRATVRGWRAALREEAIAEPWLDGRDPQTGFLRASQAEQRLSDRDARQAERHGWLNMWEDEDRRRREVMEGETPTSRAAREAVAEARFALAMAIVPHAYRPLPRYQGPRNRRAYDRWVERVLNRALIERRSSLDWLFRRQFSAVDQTHVPVWSVATSAQLAQLFLNLAAALHAQDGYDPETGTYGPAYDHCGGPRHQYVGTARAGLESCRTAATMHPEAAPIGAGCARTLHTLDPLQYESPDDELRPALR
jgi:hypothetical protein